MPLTIINYSEQVTHYAALLYSKSVYPNHTCASASLYEYTPPHLHRTFLRTYVCTKKGKSDMVVRLSKQWRVQEVNPPPIGSRKLCYKYNIFYLSLIITHLLIYTSLHHS